MNMNLIPLSAIKGKVYVEMEIKLIDVFFYNACFDLSPFN